jgi:hypothetical protein
LGERRENSELFRKGRARFGPETRLDGEALREKRGSGEAPPPVSQGNCLRKRASPE